MFKFRKWLALFLVLAVLSVSGGAVSANTVYGNDKINMVSASLSIDGGIAYCTSSVQCFPGRVTSSKVLCELQYISGGRWVTLESWVGSSENYTTTIYPQRGSLPEDSVFRVRTTGFAYQNSILVESLSCTSNNAYD